MSGLKALLSDRRRSQRGSVLSGVLIMTAFIAIISGALMTALSGTFLVSQDLMNRVQNEATVNSAIEVSVSQLQASQLYSPCPALTPVNLNGRTAVSSYSRCWPRNHESQNGEPVGVPSAAFNLDGVQAVGNGFNDYVVGNSAGSVFDYRFGATAARWTLNLNGTLTAQPMVIANGGSPNQAIDVFPMTGAACSPTPNCIDVRVDTNSGTPSQKCTISALGTVASQPAASSPSGGYGGYVYYGEGPNLDVSDLSGGDCDPLGPPVGTTQPVVAGPVALRCPSCSRVTDNVYVVVSDGLSSSLVWYTYNTNSNKFSNPLASVPLPSPNVAGIAASSVTAPADIAITFGNGAIAVAHVAASGTITLATTSVPDGISDDPYWCAACGNLLGVGAQNGVLYLFDAALNIKGSYSTGSEISTTPDTDGAGNWYVATEDGYLRELQLIQLQSGPSLVQVESYGRMSRFGSAAQVGACATGICIYGGAQDGSVYLVPLDARHAIISACISTSPPACSGANPRLAAEVEIGSAGNRQAVHVQGWSYYST